MHVFQEWPLQYQSTIRARSLPFHSQSLKNININFYTGSSTLQCTRADKRAPNNIVNQPTVTVYTYYVFTNVCLLTGLGIWLN